MRASRVVMAVVGAFALIAVVWVAGFALSWWAAPWQGKLEARQQIQSGNYRIAAYDHFFDLCASVQTADASIAVQKQQLKSVEGKDVSRVQANIAGLESARAEGINQYNADARKSYTEGQFRDSGLPFQLPDGPYQKGEEISCSVS